MAAAVILEFRGVDASQYAAVNKKLGIDMTTGKGDFTESRLGAALQEVGVPEPSRVTWVDLLAYHTP